MESREIAILIVDRDREAGAAIKRLLESSLRLECNCILVSSAEEAMILLEATLFHLVLTDIQLPGASGLEMCDFIHQTYPNTVVVIVSGLKEIRYAIDALRNGAFDYVIKPVSQKDMLAAVERALNYQEVLMAKDYCEQSLEEEIGDLLRLNRRLRLAMRASPDKKLAANASK
ncbi:MAG TPA: response regulator [Blastocatellia bacterium]|nr:response regulator [Blastocatellia bacterium]